ncbi:DNA cytosine methyltransferase, partial [Roseicitreum antarcticum]
PETLHLDSNIWDVKPLEVTGGRHVGLLWASPDCKHFSKAKGGAPRDRNIRDLAWIVVDWAEQVKPDVICMENVEEFVTWGPVDNDGQPIKELSGQIFELWIKRLKAAGYKVKWCELRACDYGAPTIRRRWFLVARRDGRPIRWPKPTHGDPKSPAVKRGKLLPWRSAAECIDWSLPCPSIFDTAPQIKALHGLRAVRPLANNTMARIARGMRRYVLEADRPFLVNLTHGARCEPADEPIRTITGAHRGEKAVVVPSIVGCGGRAAQSRARGGYEPLATMTAKADACVSTAFLATMRNSQKPWQGADEPTHTITAGGAGLTLIVPSITRFNSGATGSDMADPAPTVTANSWIKKPGGAAPLGLLAPYLASIAHGDSGGRREYPMADPLGTVVASSVKHAPFAAFLAQHHGGPRMDGNAGHDPRDPMSTIAASGSHQTPVAAWFAKYYGTGDGARTDEPMHTVTVKDRMGHMQADLAPPPFAPEHEAKARAVADFLRAHDAWAGGEFVTLEIGGQTFVVVDIGMRMLTPRELFNAQGFPADYVIEGVWQGVETDDPTFKPFAKDVQV